MFSAHNSRLKGQDRAQSFESVPVAAGLEYVTVPHSEEIEPGVIDLDAIGTDIDGDAYYLEDIQPAGESGGIKPGLDETEGLKTGVSGQGAAEPAGDDEMELSILTFNIHSAIDSEGKARLESIIDEIKETGAAIIGLQEVERMMPRSGFKDQAKAIAEALGYNYVYGGNINVLGVQYGNAFLSKYPIIENSNHKLPRELMEPRGILDVTIDIMNNPYHVFVTHLGLNANERNKQVEAINSLLADKEGPVILMGDFNNQGNSEEMLKLDSRMVDSALALEKGDMNTYSFNSDEPNVRVDRIYASEDIELKDHVVLPSEVSDHRRVITKILQKIVQ